MAENDKRFKFSVSADRYSPHWVLLKYLNQLKAAESRRLILEATAAFWRPLVAQESGQKGQGLRSLVRDCVYRLRRQEMELMSQFPVETEAVTMKALSLADDREPLSLSFNTRVYDATYFPLFNYLLNVGGSFNLSHKVLWSCQAFWGAIAHCEVMGKDSEELSVSATNCLYSLRQHIDYLKQTFNYRELGDQLLSAETTSPQSVVAYSPLSESEEIEERDENEPEAEMSVEQLDQLLRHDPVNDPWRRNIFNSSPKNAEN